MKLRNKKTGKINDIDLKSIIYPHTPQGIPEYKLYYSLAELNEEWEDYKEPKEYYCIDWTEPRGIYKTNCVDERDDFNKEIGNYFSSREEAEKAVEKLKVWKRLKDAGFKFKDFGRLNDSAFFIRATSNESWSELYDDLDLLFGGEE